ncbi:RNA 2',3'-cyclic phosphodiesterase [Parapusillimonas sp. JC17]|uniref:RNA 2',3'-cyclic phosphodiesterase n=1 Tax=Parapusillimonas sp. JC17 TaxID=3445768 RepID=UPI003FA010DE
MPDHHRIFFALWPSAEDAARLMEWAHAAQAVCGGRMNRRENLHMTLAYLGETEHERVDELLAAADGWQTHAGTMVLDRFGHFPRPKVVWAGPAADEGERLAWLHALYDDLWRRLEPLGWRRPDRPFNPHITLLRKVASCDPSCLSPPDPMAWTPQHCVLVASRSTEEGLWYEVLWGQTPCGV